MNKFFSIIIFVLISINAYSQNLSKDDFAKQYEKILIHLKSENWKDAYKLSLNLVSKIENDSQYNHETKVIKYILIYSTAGMLNNKELSKQEALAQVQSLQGSEMIMPAHPFDSNCFVNCTHLADNKPNTFFSGVNNANGTQIFSFEYVEIKNGIKEKQEELEGKLIILEGKLNKISVEGNILPRFKLEFTNGKYEVINQ